MTELFMENIRDRSIITGLYLSTFNETALSQLGFKSYQEAFNVLGFALGVKPSSIKNYRDEFDPLFPNDRKGWHKRPIRDYCKVIYDEFKNLDLTECSELIKSFFIKDYEVEKIVSATLKKDYSESVAKRLVTGKAAEEYFKTVYSKIDSFNAYNMLDTTNMACGFDYKLTNQHHFYCVEVKGLSELKGNIQLTEKEYFVAQNMRSNYCLFVVKNFKEKPIHEIIFDPLNSRLKFSEVKREIIQLSYHSSL